MPISANPKITTSFTLDKWLPLDPAERPLFLVKYLTAEEHDLHRQLVAEAVLADAEEEKSHIHDLIWKIVSLGITGWRNVRDLGGKPLEWDQDNFFAELTNAERWEIATSYPQEVRLTPLQKKASA